MNYTGLLTIDTFLTMVQGREAQAGHSGLAKLKRQRLEFEQAETAGISEMEYWKREGHEEKQL